MLQYQPPNMISIRNIVKQYSGHKALSGVSMEIEQGKVFGLLGPNGAGKTSLIRIINQITAPDSGEILFNGAPLARHHIEQIGYMPEERGLYKKMEIGEQILYLAQLKGLSRAEAKKRCKYWFEKLEIQAWWNKKIEELSKGMQQKAQFVATVLHEPELLILDEPFSGFDPVNAEIIKNEILELNQKGATIIFSTHRMESVEELCHSIALLNLSHKILDGKVKDIKNSFRTGTYIIECEGGHIDHTAAPYTLLGEHNPTEGNKQIKVKMGAAASPNDVLRHLLAQTTINRFEEVIPGMHEIFITTVNKQSAL
jgi:ABC-2 type transport system ATP-binding protein